LWELRERSKGPQRIAVQIGISIGRGKEKEWGLGKSNALTTESEKRERKTTTKKGGKEEIFRGGGPTKAGKKRYIGQKTIPKKKLEA